MASTTTATMTETIYAKLLTGQAIQAVYSAQVMDAVMRQESLVGQPSLTYSFPVWPTLTAAAGPGETVDLPSTAVDTTNVDIAVSEAATIRIDITDLLTESSLIRNAAAFAEQGSKAVADKRDSDAALLLGGFSTVIGAAGTALTEVQVLDAFATLATADAPRPYTIVLHTFQTGQLRKAVLASQASVRFNDTAEQFMGQTGFEFEYNGLPVFGTTNVPTADAAASRTGAIFSANEALARVDKRPIRVELQRDASLRATEINITSVYGQGELVDSWGVTLKSINAVGA